MKKILVVDDEQDVCNTLKRFLTRKGYEAIIALNGEEAIRKVREERPHIVLLDIKMPGMDGVEALKKIREMDKEMGIIMITGVKDEEEAKRCLELGAYDYITKPISPDYLEKVILVKLLDFS